MRAGLIYVITNKITGHQYVGLTTHSLQKRWSEHKTSAVIGRKTHFYSALRKYGPEAFETREYVSVLDKIDLATMERNIIMQLAPRYNQTNGGEVTSGRKYDDAIKERIRLRLIGKKRTPEQIERQRQIGATLWATNPEYRKKSLEAMAKARSMIDHTTRLEALHKARASYVYSEETRAKMSASCMGRRYGPDVIAKMAATKRKPVRCNETGEVFSCSQEAADKTGMKAQMIWQQCKGKVKKPRSALTFSYVGASQ